MLDLSILIVSHNTRALMLACLDSIRRETDRIAFEVILVDNASSDGSAAAAAAHPLGPRVLALPENVGFAGANIIAAGQARGRCLLLLNPDTVVLDRALERLLDFAAEYPHAGIWGGRTLFADGRLNASSCWAEMTLWNLVCRAAGLTGLFPNSAWFNCEAYGGWKRDTIREVDIVTGCFLLITRRLWDRLGGFDPAYFMYGEDADLCLRARARGARPMITPEATIIHYGGASEPTREGKMIKLLAAKASLIARHWHRLRVPLGLVLLAGWPLSRTLAYGIAAHFTGSPAHAKETETWRAIWSGHTRWARASRQVDPARPVPPALQQALVNAPRIGCRDAREMG
jgi:GT2 family glycosyltransferase